MPYALYFNCSMHHFASPMSDAIASYASLSLLTLGECISSSVCNVAPSSDIIFSINLRSLRLTKWPARAQASWPQFAIRVRLRPRSLSRSFSVTQTQYLYPFQVRYVPSQFLFMTLSVSCFKFSCFGTCKQIFDFWSLFFNTSTSAVVSSPAWSLSKPCSADIGVLRRITAGGVLDDPNGVLSRFWAAKRDSSRATDCRNPNFGYRL